MGRQDLYQFHSDPLLECDLDSIDVHLTAHVLKMNKVHRMHSPRHSPYSLGASTL